MLLQCRKKAYKTTITWMNAKMIHKVKNDWESGRAAEIVCLFIL